MVFNSLTFALFLGIVYAAFLMAPARQKRVLLLGASYIFYGFSSVKACFILAAVSLICFFGGRAVRRLEGNPVRQRNAILGIIAALILILAYFKYVTFIAQYLSAFFSGMKTGQFNLLFLFIPVGVSYYIFQGIGYLVDVYWGKEVEDDPLDFLLFMSFFPKLMMGPIERGEGLLPQIKKLPAFQFSYDNFRQALLLFAWGLFKKLVVAERLSLYVNEVYGKPGAYSGVTVAIATLFFALQLYSDFSGYTDMALGVGKLFHLDLTQNFDRPYYATNIQDFWRRWLISFSSWIATYVFTPLRMQLRTLGNGGLILCFFITFILVGAWHGTGWPFIVFGILHGIYMTVSHFTLKTRDTFWKKRGQAGKFWLIGSRRLITFTLVCFSLIFFRSPSIVDALILVQNLFKFGPAKIGIRNGLMGFELLIALATVLFMEIVEMFLRSDRKPFGQLIVQPLWLRWAAYTTLILAILCFGMFINPQKFIYFAF